ncbi:probable inactive receptor kinase At2g26730 [Mangifera indica]|uniref:probable inactive receptor kinase At2g26730 n=1 Tax=Mangifera indica TaxID=29780 RepID=UPI001CFC052D|nr:probable inactive receptor kinase At2g26730 [Mangifera indica]
MPQVTFVSSANWHLATPYYLFLSYYVTSDHSSFIKENSNWSYFANTCQSRMDRISFRALPILIFLLLPAANSELQEVKDALVLFMEKLSPGNATRGQNWGWNTSSDPCNDKWEGVSCDDTTQHFVKRIVLEGFNLSGILDSSSVCTAKSLAVLSLKGNNISGILPEDISSCKQLTHLFLSGNRFTGKLPDSLSQLSNLKRLEIANNSFSGELPDVARISGLITFYVENNQLSGGIPDFDFLNLQDFSVSNNNFSGPIPDVKGRFNADSFSGNPGLCGKPLSNACPPTSPPEKKSKGSTNDFLLYLGYIIIGLLVLLFITLRLVRKKKSKAKTDTVKKGVAQDTGTNKPSSTSTGSKTGDNRSEYSITSAEGGIARSSLVVLSSPAVNGLTFEELLRAPAELLGKGKHGSLYKVMLDNGEIMAVKRLKDWSISSEDFKRRMEKIDQVKQPNVLPPVAYYCSNQEKLLVYEYQPNGSLFKLLHESPNDQSFDWGSRLGVAAGIAQSLAFMHEKLHEDGIAHGNLKSTNILFNKNMDPCVSEYGLMAIENQGQSSAAQSSSFMSDVYGFGVILLELLTGKLVENNGFDLAKWVHSVVREEWTVEVFDKALVLEGANEERMVNLLQVALKCVNPSPSERPSMNQIAVMINAIQEEEERSAGSEP